MADQKSACGCGCALKEKDAKPVNKEKEAKETKESK
jgi:hypothetical protein